MERMETRNQTTITELIFLGFHRLHQWKMYFFFPFLLAYALTITANAVIITTVWRESRLHTPMYFFLSNFSFMEIWYTTVTVPKMLSGFLAESNTTISITGCIMQLYFFFFLGTTECTLLAVMAYDRYIAICSPLHYTTLMNSKVCTQLAVASWLSGLMAPLPLAISTTWLLFCGPNEINHFFCDLAPVLNLSCTDTSVSEMIFFTFSWVVILCSFLLTMVSYCSIIYTICRMSSTTGRRRAFSTCASHLTVVTIFYSTVTFMYVRPTAHYTFQEDRVVSIFYCVVTPLLNPVIYNLRNKEVKEALGKFLCSGRRLNQKNFGLS